MPQGWQGRVLGAGEKRGLAQRLQTWDSGGHAYWLHPWGSLPGWGFSSASHLRVGMNPALCPARVHPHRRPFLPHLCSSAVPGVPGTARAGAAMDPSWVNVGAGPYLLFLVSYCRMFLMKWVFFRPLCLGEPGMCLVLQAKYRLPVPPEPSLAPRAGVQGCRADLYLGTEGHPTVSSRNSREQRWEATRLL